MIAALFDSENTTSATSRQRKWTVSWLRSGERRRISQPWTPRHSRGATGRRWPLIEASEPRGPDERVANDRRFSGDFSARSLHFGLDHGVQHSGPRGGRERQLRRYPQQLEAELVE